MQPVRRGRGQLSGPADQNAKISVGHGTPGVTRRPPANGAAAIHVIPPGGRPVGTASRRAHCTAPRAGTGDPCYHRDMRAEAELVPYAPGRLDGSPILVLAPHPDDEVFGCGGALALAVRAGATVRTVVLTDGGAQGDPEVRRAETAEAARRLGIPEPEHWSLPDRSLDPSDIVLRDRLAALIAETGPAIVLAPSPAEVHPDHRALALTVYRLLQTVVPGTPIHGAAPALRLAAYEVSAVLRPNLLVDVSEVWEEVLAAAKAYASQVSLLPYVEVLEGVASMRRLTLPSSVRRAEAYHVVDLRYVRTHSAAEWAAAQGPSAGLEAVREAAPMDVVVRTAGRPHLLA
ncbi:MAG TPA: PIG-L family deacetylase, partial [Acidobacteria bacterium]|nr:PIG-L family deacetylase [Acidobacteriota bacterium]